MSTQLSPSDILEAVAEMDENDLDELQDLIKIRRRHLSDRVRVGLRIGDTVSFPGRTRGLWAGIQTGTLEKKNPKKAKIAVPHPVHGYKVTWTVPWTMVTKV